MLEDVSCLLRTSILAHPPVPTTACRLRRRRREEGGTAGGGGGQGSIDLGFVLDLFGAVRIAQRADGFIEVDVGGRDGTHHYGLGIAPQTLAQDLEAGQ